MNEIVRVPPMSLVVVGLSAAFISEAATWPTREPPAYVTQRDSPTFSYFEKARTFAFSDQDFAGGIARVYAALLRDQEPFGAEFEAIWDANLALLYEP